MRYLKAIIFCMIAAISTMAMANMDASKESVEKVGAQWAAALSSESADKIAALYDKQAFLFATFTNMLDTPEAIHQYFVGLVKHKDLKVKFDQQHIRLYGDAAINSGLYEFSFTKDGKTITVPARYTFVYHMDGDKWMIIDHHSSAMPE